MSRCPKLRATGGGRTETRRGQRRRRPRRPILSLKSSRRSLPHPPTSARSARAGALIPLVNVPFPASRWHTRASPTSTHARYRLLDPPPPPPPFTTLAPAKTDENGSCFTARGAAGAGQPLAWCHTHPPHTRRPTSLPTPEDIHIERERKGEGGGRAAGVRTAPHPHSGEHTHTKE